MSYKELLKEMREIPHINRRRTGIVHFTAQHKRIFHKLGREHNWTRNNIRMLQHYMIANRMHLVDAFKKVYNSQYI